MSPLRRGRELEVAGEVGELFDFAREDGGFDQVVLAAGDGGLEFSRST